jgi:hypothetical protein
MALFAVADISAHRRRTAPEGREPRAKPLTRTSRPRAADEIAVADPHDVVAVPS